MLGTQKYDFDLDSIFRRGSQRCRMFMTINLRIPSKNALGWQATVACGSELIMLCEANFYVVFY